MISVAQILCKFVAIASKSCFGNVPKKNSCVRSYLWLRTICKFFSDLYIESKVYFRLAKNNEPFLNQFANRFCFLYHGKNTNMQDENGLLFH